MNNSTKHPRFIRGRYNDIHYRGAETAEFIFFCNYQEGDMNANVIMFRKDEFAKNSKEQYGYSGLLSDNYFASNHLYELMLKIKSPFLYLSPTMKINIRLMHENGEFDEG